MQQWAAALLGYAAEASVQSCIEVPAKGTDGLNYRFSLVRPSPCRLAALARLHACTKNQEVIISFNTRPFPLLPSFGPGALPATLRCDETVITVRAAS